MLYESYGFNCLIMINMIIIITFKMYISLKEEFNYKIIIKKMHMAVGEALGGGPAEGTPRRRKKVFKAQKPCR